MKVTTLEERYASISEAGRLLGVAEETVRWYFKTGKLRGLRIAGRRVINRTSVENLLKKRRATHGGDDR